MEAITTEDLRQFRLQLISDIRDLLTQRPAEKLELPADWLKSSRVRRVLDISPGTLQNLRISGKIRFQRIGGSYYYSREDLAGLFANLAAGQKSVHDAGK